MHPMILLNKLNNILREAGVPDECKKGLALAYLKGTAADWESIKEDSFTTYEDFDKSDSSDYALGGSLHQMGDEGKREVVAYTSYTFKEGQLTYPY
ncbi:hypothetical protein JTB14_012733 [Gonioctena quinquepunctata]|nr:hypothetical protein JTB14_012733 [Gonioctena quinquepunctata]